MAILPRKPAELDRRMGPAREKGRLLAAALLSAAAIVGMLIPAAAAQAEELTSASYTHRAGVIVSSSAVGARALQSSAAVPTFAGMDANVGAAPTARPTGSTTTLVSLLPGYLALVVGAFPTLDLDADLSQFFLDLDDDGDGLEDEYETGTGFFVSETNTGTSPVAVDSDGDGFDDGVEVLAGSDPNSPGSMPGSPQVPAMAMPLRWLMLGLMVALATMSLGRPLSKGWRRGRGGARPVTPRTPAQTTPAQTTPPEKTNGRR